MSVADAEHHAACSAYGMQDMWQQHAVHACLPLAQLYRHDTDILFLVLHDHIVYAVLICVTQKSFEEMQAAVRARKQAAAGAAAGNSSSTSGSSETGAQQQQGDQNEVYHIRSSWADSMRGRFVDAQPGDPSVPSAVAGGTAAASSAAQQ